MPGVFQKPHKNTEWLRRIAIVACLAIGITFSLKAMTTEVSATTGLHRSQETRQLASVAPPLTTVSIEDIQLGQRVVGRNPLREETQPPSDINPATWRAVQLSMFKGGVKYDLAFLRPLSWLESNSAKVGHSIHLEMHEMGLNGPAKVVAIDPCPQIEPDDGTSRNVVTGTMAHPGPNILYLNITGLNETLGVTDTHPIWSETRHEFVVAGKLEVGEQFKTLTGETSTLTKITPHRGPPEMVFNLEVDGEHVYSVASNGLLVHNDCVDLFRAVSPDEFDDIMRTGNFNPFPGAMEDKLFVTDLGDALRVADQPALIDAAAVVKTSVPGDVYDLLGHSNTIDTWAIDNGTVIVPSNLLDLFNSTKETVVHAF
ncbi:polymorphic toxin-type HINT domain-containing protein [Fuerstiella marisgermanici]|uniref:Intein C-terminal splicing domain-containing protein n=1 Tax=Fuerstiella marisgermanici TaxID=1891926 RepID=A0A1P8WKC0_9PLAN|nr:polymorphic toxin-type HINT domain-containing protein [Fuerstiella marisgermanici]APZ94504.1 hypothetical protein Fuma_04136 [Fuerstiella marisgermanici]